MIATIIEIVGGAAVMAALATHWVATGFLMVPTAKAMLDSGIHIPRGVLASVYLNVAKGYLGDFLYNTIVGTVRFKELPHWHKGELMYSARVQRHIDSWRYAFPGKSAEQLYEYGDSQFDIAYRWALILNAGWPDHIHLGPVSPEMVQAHGPA